MLIVRYRFLTFDPFINAGQPCIPMTTSGLTRRALRDGHVSAMIPLYAVKSVASGWALMGITWNNAGGVVRVYAKKNANPSSSPSSSVG